ncbi:pilus assembly protein [Vibrio profundum]|uniref:TadE/TadG family type IV pilus assembly protein n=1 Tax=Vibrio profundum TaxID=2910247 RepID=UPI003D0B7353
MLMRSGLMRSGYRVSHKGFAAVEMTLVMPVLFLFIVGIWELTSMIQANTIITNISREGANIVSRASAQTPQDVMAIVALTSSPLDLEEDGIIYISQVVGQESDPPYINNQYRWTEHGIDVESDVWAGCGSWDSEGTCQLPDDKPTTNSLPMTLSDGESVYVVEVIYRYSPVYDWVYDSDFVMSDTTYL